jgi:hypothetical protein
MMELENVLAMKAYVSKTPFGQQKVKMLPYYVCALNILVSNGTWNGL